MICASKLRDLVGVGEVACRRHEKTEFSGRRRRPHDEHDIFLGDAGAGSNAQPHGIDAALETGRHGHAVGCFPAAVGHRIGVEFDAAELGRIKPEAIVLAVPIPAGHRAHGVIETLCVESMGTGVGHFMADAARGIIPRSVPVGEHRICGRQSALPTIVKFGSAQHAAGRWRDGRSFRHTGRSQRDRAERARLARRQ